MSWLQIIAVGVVACLLLFRIVPWKNLATKTKKVRPAGDPLKTDLATLATYCVDADDDTTWDAWRVLLELSKDHA